MFTYCELKKNKTTFYKTVPEIPRSLLILVAKALQEFDLALRGKKKRKKFMKEAKKKGEMTVSGLPFGGGSLPGALGQGCLICSVHTRHPSPQAEERSQFEILKAQMFAERLAKRNRRAKRARAMPEEEPVRAPGR